MNDWMERLGMALSDSYAIEREIGSGGMAKVYLARDLKHRRQVAIKVLRPEISHAVGSERFLREIEMVAGLSHPHLLPLYDSGEAEGLLYYVMPYIPGPTLRERLAREGALRVDEAVRVAREVANALAYAHRQSIVHRDVKPENILFSDGHALLADFGIGKAVCDVCDDAITLAGTPIGTPAYMSPEQILAEDVDGRSDVYSLGCVLFEMLTGKPPFTGTTPRITLMRHAMDPIPPVRQARAEVPEVLGELVTKALSKDAAERFASAEHFAMALGPETTLGTGVPVVAGSVERSRSRWPRRRRLALGGALAVIGAATGWWLLGSGFTGPRSVEALAVLPLVNLSGDPAQQHFVDGVHDALIAEVAQIGALKVISRTSVIRYRDSEKSIPEIARELSVDAVLEGSLTRSGDSVRIIAQLIGIDPERHLWSQTFEREWRDLFSVHTEIAKAIARRLETDLTPELEARLATARPLEPQVLDSYLEGRFHAARGSVDGFRLAVTAYDKVLSQAPDFALAHSARALATHLLGFYGGLPQSQSEPRAKAAAERALVLDPNLAEARAVLAGIRSMYDWDWEGAEREYRRAIALDPSSSIARRWYAYHLSAMGRHAEAAAEARRGVELDPLNPFAWFVLADQFLYARDYAQADRFLRRALELEAGMGQATATREDLLTLMGRYDDAVAHRRARLLEQGSARDSASAADLVRRYMASGAQGYWQWRLQRLQTVADSGFVGPREFARTYAALGATEEAVSWLERAFAARDGMEMLQVSPYLDRLRGDPRFEALVERMQFPRAAP